MAAGQLPIGVPKDHPTIGDPGLSLTEAQSVFSMWCMFQSLLMATNDVRKNDTEIERILLNPETIAINREFPYAGQWSVDGHWKRVSLDYM